MADLTITGTGNTLATGSINAFLTTSDPRGRGVANGDKLIFDPNATTTLTVDNTNLIIEEGGEIEMKPASASVVHTLRFTNINEALFTGSMAYACTNATSNGTTITYTLTLRPGQTSHNITTSDRLIATNGFDSNGIALPAFSPAGYNSTAESTGYDVTAVTATTVTVTPASPQAAGNATVLGVVRAHDHQPAMNDKGLWVFGVLDAVGTTRKPWTRATVSVSGTNPANITCADTLTGWQVGDTIIATPTISPQVDSNHYNRFSSFTVASVSGSTVSLTGTAGSTSGTSWHAIKTLPSGTQYGTELLNLTRNVIIEGQDRTHRTHTMFHFHTLQPLTMSYVRFRFCGPRENNGAGGTRKIVGRWPVHFHKAEANSVGSVLTGVVVDQSDTHAYVTHASNGVTIRDCIAYDTNEEPYWWDLDQPGDNPDGILWDRCVAARSTSLDNTGVQRYAGFFLGMSDTGDITVKDCVATGIQAGTNSAGFVWPEIKVSPGNRVWIWQGTNVSHNNRQCGFLVWQNPNVTHEIDHPVAYCNGQAGIFLGAYVSTFRWTNMDLMDNNIELDFHAQSRFSDTGLAQVWTGDVDCAGEAFTNLGHAILAPDMPIGVLDLTVRNMPANDSITIDEAPPALAHCDPKTIDYVRCKIYEVGSGVPRNIDEGDINYIRARPGFRMRVQSMDDTEAWQFYVPPLPGQTPGQNCPNWAVGTVPVADPVWSSIAVFALHVTTQSLANGVQGSAYPTQTLQSALGQGTKTWSVGAGALPPGLSLNTSTGAITGTPTTPGTFPFVARVRDAVGWFADKDLVIVVTASGSTLTITTTSLPGGQVGVVYNDGPGVEATGGTAPYTFSLQAGALPGGLSLSGAGAITGTPTASGTFNFTIRVTDNAAATFDRALSIVIVPAVSPPNITTTSVPGGQIGVAYTSTTLQVSGGTSPYTWSLAAGALPGGITLSTAGVLSGTPTASGTFNFTVRVTDNASQTDTQALTIVVAAAVAITTSSLPASVVGGAYSQALAATGGTAPYTWTLVSGALPGGLGLSSSGTISGTCTTAGTFNFTVRATDTVSQFANRALTISVGAAVNILTTTMSSGTVGLAYSVPVLANGGTTPYTWAISAGSLPTGLTINSSTGFIAGTPSAAGAFNFTVRVTDANTVIDTQALAILINPGLTVSTTSLPGGEVGSGYTATLHATGGTPPYSWSIAGQGGSGGGVAGTLPLGLVITDAPNELDGVISGTPAEAGVFDFSVVVIDTQQTVDSQTLQISVQVAPGPAPVFDDHSRDASLSQGGEGNAEASLDVGF